MADEFDTFLDGAVEPAAEIPAETIETPETGEVAAEIEVAAPATPAEPQEEWTKAAYLAEKAKRQEAERLLLERQQAEQQRQVEEEDPYAASIKNELVSQMEQRLAVERMNLSEAFARDKYSDFDDKLNVFAEMTRVNPNLYQQMAQQSNPAEFAYKTASNQQKLQEMSDIPAYEAKLREQIRKELEAENKVKLDELLKKQNIPGTLADARGAAGTHEAAWSGPPPLKDLLA